MIEYNIYTENKTQNKQKNIDFIKRPLCNNTDANYFRIFLLIMSLFCADRSYIHILPQGEAEQKVTPE